MKLRYLFSTLITISTSQRVLDASIFEDEDYIINLFDWDSAPTSSEIIFIRHNIGGVYSPMTHRLFSTFPYEELQEKLSRWRNESAPSAERVTFVIFQPQKEEEVWNSIANILVLLRYLRRIIFFIVWPTLLESDQPLVKLFTERRREMVTDELLFEYQLTIDLYFVFLSSKADSRSGTLIPYEEGGRNSTWFRVSEFYTLKSTVFFKPLAIVGNKIDFEKITMKLTRRSDFAGLEVAAMAKDDSTMQYEVSFVKGSNSTSAAFKSGSAVEVYWNLRDMLNFTEKALIGAFDGRRSESVFTQLREYFAKGGQSNPELSISQIAVQQFRFNDNKFLQPTASDDGVFAIFEQPAQSRIRNIFSIPFSSHLWGALGGTWAAIVIVVLVMHKVFHMQVKVHAEEDFDGDSSLWAIAAICQRSYVSTPFFPPTRIPFIVGQILAVTIYTAYSAKITSVFAIKTYPVESFEDLVNFHYLFYAHEKSTSVRTLLHDTLIPVYNLPQDVLLTDTAHEVAILNGGTRALLSYIDSFYSAATSLGYSDHFICEKVDRIPVNRYPLKYAMIVRIGSPLRETFDHKIMMMMERGLIHRYKSRYASEAKPLCDERSAQTLEPVDLIEVYWAFFVLLMVHVIGLITLALERLWWRSRKENTFFYYVD